MYPLLAPLRYLKTQSLQTQGMFWSISSSFWFAVMAILVQISAQHMHPMVMVFGRNICSLLFLLPYIPHHGIKRLAFTGKFHLHVARSTIGAVGMMLWFYSLTIMPINDAIALSFSAPLFVTILAVIFLSEKVGVHRCMALFIGIIGTIIILRPGTSAFHIQSLIVLGTTCFWALATIFMKLLSKTEHPFTIVFYFSVIMIPISLPFALMHWEPLSFTDILLLFAIGCTSSLGQLSLTTAISKTDTSFVALFDFFRLVFSSIFVYLIFQQTPAFPVILGAVIITSSTFYITRREILIARKNHKKTHHIIGESLIS